MPGGGAANRKRTQARAATVLQARPGRRVASPLDQDSVDIRRAVRYYLLRNNRSPYEYYVSLWEGQVRYRRPTIDEGGQLLHAYREHRILLGYGRGERGVIEDESPIDRRFVRVSMRPLLLARRPGFVR